ncbi:lysophospholipid acyltransferase family protein [Streptomyces sp. NPDC020898]|uniref:lysophospholipid acyltransferase family protein n=1 Tax=Streptomyces sp. NPDC020898 TaxID=3365101 RepID=UPI00378E577E
MLRGGAVIARALLLPLAKVRIGRVRVRPLPGRGLIIASNHRSMLDFVVGLVAFRRWGVAPVTMVRGDYFKNPLYGAILRRLGAIPAGRGYGASAMDRAREVLRSGGVLAMAPEGRIPDHGERVDGVAELKPGVARLAAEFGSEILLVGISDTDRVWRKGSRTPLFLGGGGPRPVISLSVELFQPSESASERDITTAVTSGLARLIALPSANSRETRRT